MIPWSWPSTKRWTFLLALALGLGACQSVHWPTPRQEALAGHSTLTEAERVLFPSSRRVYLLQASTCAPTATSTPTLASPGESAFPARARHFPNLRVCACAAPDGSTPAPSSPAPVTPAPVTPAPVSPAPVSPAPSAATPGAHGITHFMRTCTYTHARTHTLTHAARMHARRHVQARAGTGKRTHAHKCI